MSRLALVSLVDAGAAIGTPYVTKRLIDTVAMGRSAGGVQGVVPGVAVDIGLLLYGALSQRLAAHLARVARPGGRSRTPSAC
jgi:hypothetical protein